MKRFFEIVNLSVPSENRKQRAIALGMFDGVHLGHQALIRAVKERAEKYNLISCAVSFRETPIKWTPPQTKVQLITTLEERLLLFKQFGIEQAIIFDFPELVNLEPSEYLNQVLKDKLQTSFIACGENHHFGKNQIGDLNFLTAWALQNEVELQVLRGVKNSNGKIVSSSLIRQSLTNGNLKEASELLGHTFISYQPLQEGQHKGRLLGYPTLNFHYSPDKVELPLGVYAARTEIEGINYTSAVNLGLAPTVERQASSPILESHLLHAPAAIDMPKNGDMVKIELLEFIRAERKFANLDELKEQIGVDCRLISQRFG